MRFLIVKTLQDEIVVRFSETCSGIEGVFGKEFIGLVLFSIVARGEAGGDSNADVLVVFRGLNEMDVRSKSLYILAKRIKKLLTIIGLPADMLREGIASLWLRVGSGGAIICDKMGVLCQ